MHSRIQSQWRTDYEGWGCDGWSTQLGFSFQLDHRLHVWQWTNEFKCCEKLWTNCVYGKQHFNHTILIKSWKIFSSKGLFRQSLQSTALLIFKSIVGFVWKLRIGRLGQWTRQWRRMRGETKIMYQNVLWLLRSYELPHNFMVQWKLNLVLKQS